MAIDYPQPLIPKRRNQNEWYNPQSSVLLNNYFFGTTVLTGSLRKVKVGGSFIAVSSIKTKAGGTFGAVTAKIKVGGSFI